MDSKLKPSLIPIENIYYLLCYAWDQPEIKEQIPVSADKNDSVLELLCKIMIQATGQLLKRGIDRNYTEINAEITGIKGKMLFSDSLKQHSFLHSKTCCLFDEFSPDTLPNQIICTTLFNLLHTCSVGKKYGQALIQLYRMFPSVSRIQLCPQHFRQIRLHRNNTFYGFILKVCQLIHECLLTTENPGEYLFTDFRRDEQKMALLFEKFVYNFYCREVKEYKIRRENIRWQFTASAAHQPYIPLMRTDITLENQKRKIIIDTKYYTRTLTQNFDAHEKVHPSHLYQLFSYLKNQENGEDITQQATGILLYPVCSKEYEDINFTYASHRILIRTVNLNTHWQNISQRLKEIVRKV